MLNLQLILYIRDAVKLFKATLLSHQTTHFWSHGSLPAPVAKGRGPADLLRTGCYLDDSMFDHLSKDHLSKVTTFNSPLGGGYTSLTVFTVWFTTCSNNVQSETNESSRHLQCVESSLKKIPRKKKRTSKWHFVISNHVSLLCYSF